MRILSAGSEVEQLETHVLQKFKVVESLWKRVQCFLCSTARTDSIREKDHITWKLFSRGTVWDKLWETSRVLSYSDS